MNTLKILRKRKNVTQNDVAKYLGVTTSAYGQYETGARQPNLEILTKLSDYFEVSTDEILGREEITEPFRRPIQVKPELIPEDEYMLPVVASLRCGFNKAGEPCTVMKRIPVPVTYVKRWGKNIVGIEAVGRSMMPTIRPYDICICIPGSAWDDNQIVVFDINDSDTIKRIFRSKDQGIDLVPDNEEYEPMHYTPEELDLYQAQVLARVVKTIPPDL